MDLYEDSRLDCITELHRLIYYWLHRLIYAVKKLRLICTNICQIQAFGLSEVRRLMLELQKKAIKRDVVG